MARFHLTNGGIPTSRKAKKTVDSAGRKRTNSIDAQDPSASDTLSMSVSGICGEPGKLFAFVRFEDGKRYCEYRFPDVELRVNDGFSEDELVQLKFYVKNNIPQLKKMAASVDPFHALKNG